MFSTVWSIWWYGLLKRINTPMSDKLQQACQACYTLPMLNQHHPMLHVSCPICYSTAIPLMCPYFCPPSLDLYQGLDQVAPIDSLSWGKHARFHWDWSISFKEIEKSIEKHFTMLSNHQKQILGSAAGLGSAPTIQCVLPWPMSHPSAPFKSGFRSCFKQSC